MQIMLRLFILMTSDKVVYGIDNRVDFYAIPTPLKALIAKSTAVLINTTRVAEVNSLPATIFHKSSAYNILQTANTIKVNNSKFKDIHVNPDDNILLCSDVQYGNQLAAAFCTGFLVAPTILVTAGHCLTSYLEDTLIAFDYFEKSLNQSIEVTRTFKNEDLNAIEEVLAANTGVNDFAILRLKRPVTKYLPLKVRRQNKIPDNSNLYILGSPTGLPIKYADGASVKDNRYSDVFIATLDSFGGNSGSPVFNEADNLLEGILIRGQVDFEIFNQAAQGYPDNFCYKVKVCPSNPPLDIEGCSGEHSYRTTNIAHYLDVLDYY